MDNKANEQLTQQLELERAIDFYLDEIVQMAEKRSSTYMSSSDKKVKKTQLRNALAMAASTYSSFEAIKNWVYYQTGRSSDSRWPLSLGEGIVKDCIELKSTAQKISKNLSMDEKLIHVRLVRLYLGYFNRDYTYRNRDQDKE